MDDCTYYWGASVTSRRKERQSCLSFNFSRGFKLEFGKTSEEFHLSSAICCLLISVHLPNVVYMESSSTKRPSSNFATSNCAPLTCMGGWNYWDDLCNPASLDIVTSRPQPPLNPDEHQRKKGPSLRSLHRSLGKNTTSYRSGSHAWRGISSTRD